MSDNHIKPPEIGAIPDGWIEVITTHLNADFDAVASMIAAGKLYPNAIMVFPGSQERNIRNFFIQSVIYLFHVARVKEVRMEEVGRLILVDTRQKNRIGPLEKVLENEGLVIHIYDHHPDSDDDLHGEIEVVEEVGANATIMTEILAAKEISLSPEEATVLALGIYEDTGAFTFRSTTPRDYRAAAYLLEQGADLNVVAEMISRELTVDQVSLLNDLINSVETHTINGIDVVIAQATTQTYVDELAVLVHKMMDIKNLRVMFALARMEDRIYLVARSRLEHVDVGEIARKLGGGGHPSAAAATIKDMTLPQAVVKLLRTLSVSLTPVRTARDIMVFPVISVAPENSFDEARELFVRYDINVLLVVSSEGRLQGYLSRQNVAKALHHGLPDYQVSELMSTEFGAVAPEATFDEIQALIVEQKQRVVPVVEDGRPVGVITRTDLLNILTSETNVPGTLIDETIDTKTGRKKKIRNLMQERLPRDILELLADIGRTADRLGYGAFAVGGFVRDIFVRQENLDIDIVIEGDAIRFTEFFAKEHPGVRVRQHKKFNTAVVIFPNDLKVDVTTARMEYYEHPGALPVVQKGSIRMDLYRRDFSINTLAISLSQRNFGTVIDYFRGLKDLKDGFIRVLHNLSFVEDPTRVFRAIRFEQRFGFKIGKLTASLIQNAVKHDFFLKLSGKRLMGEIRLILKEDDPWPAVARLDEFDLLKFIQSGLKLEQELNGLFRNVKKVRDWFHLTYITEPFQPWLVYFLALMDNAPQAEMPAVCRRLILSKHEKRILLFEKPRADDALVWLGKRNELRPSEAYFLLAPLSTETILFMMAKTSRDETARMISKYFTELRHVQPEMTGKDLINLGLTPGPHFKKILDNLLAARLDGEVGNRADEEDLVRKRYLLPAA